MDTSPGPERGQTDDASPTQLELLNRAVQRLEVAGRSTPQRTAEWLLKEVMGGDRAQLYAHPERPVAPEAARQFEDMVERCVGGEPLQHVLGHTAFYGLRIQVSPDVMVPRPETEVVVDRARTCLDERDMPRVLDVGTGSGCLALALKHERPDAEVSACDVSPDALAVARTNADTLGLDVQFLEADVLADEIPDGMPGELDLLVSNPPYIPNDEAGALPPVVHEYDPALSLFAGEDPLCFYRALLRWARVLCKPCGAVVVEAHAEYADEVGDLFRRAGLVEVAIDMDLSDRPRVVWGRMSEEGS